MELFPDPDGTHPPANGSSLGNMVFFIRADVPCYSEAICTAFLPARAEHNGQGEGGGRVEGGTEHGAPWYSEAVRTLEGGNEHFATGASATHGSSEMDANLLRIRGVPRPPRRVRPILDPPPPVRPPAGAFYAPLIFSW
jgi:hypothetical protein